MSNIPVITVAQDFDTGECRLMATSFGMTAPAGPRLFRAPPHPDIQFTHSDPESAERDAEKLRAHMADKWSVGANNKKSRMMGAD